MIPFNSLDIQVETFMRNVSLLTSFLKMIHIRYYIRTIVSDMKYAVKIRVIWFSTF